MDAVIKLRREAEVKGVNNNNLQTEISPHQQRWDGIKFQPQLFYLQAKILCSWADFNNTTSGWRVLLKNHIHTHCHVTVLRHPLRNWLISMNSKNMCPPFNQPSAALSSLFHPAPPLYLRAASHRLLLVQPGPVEAQITQRRYIYQSSLSSIFGGPGCREKGCLSGFQC